jgi:hypothetical protein
MISGLCLLSCLIDMDRTKQPFLKKKKKKKNLVKIVERIYSTIIRNNLNKFLEENANIDNGVSFKFLCNFFFFFVCCLLKWGYGSVKCSAR